MGAEKMIIHINSAAIQRNARKKNEDTPVFEVGQLLDGAWQHKFHKGIEIEGKIKLVYSNSNPLPSGARVWIEVDENAKVEFK